MSFDDLYGAHARTFQAFERAKRIACEGRMPFLVVGESGTGKNLIAQAMHNASGREGPFVSVGVADLPDRMAEATLFGARKGSYTGATEDRIGLVQEAAGGTLFFEDVADFDMNVQRRLLAVLDYGQFRPLGETKEQHCTARIGAGVQADPEQLVQEGRLRRDLLHRLQGGVVRLPPLRERGDDAVLVARRLLADRPGPARRLSAAAEDLLRKHSWPGNLRELRRVVLSAAGCCTKEEIPRETFDLLDTALGVGEEPTAGGPAANGVAPDSHRLEDVERWAIERALRACGGHRGRTARMLDVSEAKLYRDLKKYGLIDVR